MNEQQPLMKARKAFVEFKDVGTRQPNETFVLAVMTRTYFRGENLLVVNDDIEIERLFVGNILQAPFARIDTAQPGIHLTAYLRAKRTIQDYSFKITGRAVPATADQAPGFGLPYDEFYKAVEPIDVGGKVEKSVARCPRCGHDLAKEVATTRRGARVMDAEISFDLVGKKGEVIFHEVKSAYRFTALKTFAIDTSSHPGTGTCVRRFEIAGKPQMPPKSAVLTAHFCDGPLSNGLRRDVCPAGESFALEVEFLADCEFHAVFLGVATIEAENG